MGTRKKPSTIINLLITYIKKKEKKIGYSTATRQIDYLQRVYYIYIYLHQ